MAMILDSAQRRQIAPLARNSNFLLLVGGQFVSQMGDRLAMVAFPWLVYSTTRSALSTGIVLALFTLPYVIFGTIAGGVLDRVDKRGVMVAADIARGGLVLAVPFVAQRTTGGVFVLAFLTACATVFFDPGLMALLPDIVPEEALLRANSVLQQARTSRKSSGSPPPDSSSTTSHAHSLHRGCCDFRRVRSDTAGHDASAVLIRGRQRTDRPKTSRRPRLLPRSARACRIFATTLACARIRCSRSRRGRRRALSTRSTFLLAADRFGGTAHVRVHGGRDRRRLLCAPRSRWRDGGRVRKGLAITIGLMVMGDLLRAAMGVCTRYPWCWPTSWSSAPPMRPC